MNSIYNTPKRLQPVILFLFSIFLTQAIYSQGIYQCKLTKENLKPYVDSKINKQASDKATLIYDSLKTLKPQLKRVNYDDLMPCNKVNTFIAYFDNKQNTRLVFYPSGYINNLNRDWTKLGAFLHAVIHLQKDHSDKNNAYLQELEADRETAEVLALLGASYQQAIGYLQQTSPDMPPYEERLKQFEPFYPKPVPDFSASVDLNNCVEPCVVTFYDKSTNVTAGARYFWNGTERGKSFTTTLNAGFHDMTLKVINQGGRDSSVRKPIVVKKRSGDVPGSGTGPGRNVTPTTTTQKFGLHGGFNYSTYFERIGVTGGLVYNVHRDWLGLQAELNYIRRIDGVSYFESEYDPFWDDYDYYYDDYMYTVHNVELPVMLVIGKDRYPKVSLMGLAGISLNYALFGRVYYSWYYSYADGSEDSGAFEYPLDFIEDAYNKVHVKGTLGFAIEKDYFCWGNRLDIGLADYYSQGLELRSYLMFRF